MQVASLTSPPPLPSLTFSPDSCSRPEGSGLKPVIWRVGYANKYLTRNDQTISKKEEPQVQFCLDDISGIGGTSKPVPEHARSAALFQLLVEKGGCLKGKKPFSTKTSSARALRPVSQKPFAFPLTESEHVTSLMTSGNRKLESERNKLQSGSRCLTTNSLSEEEQYLYFMTGTTKWRRPVRIWTG